MVCSVITVATLGQSSHWVSVSSPLYCSAIISVVCVQFLWLCGSLTFPLRRSLMQCVCVCVCVCVCECTSSGWETNAPVIFFPCFHKLFGDVQHPLVMSQTYRDTELSCLAARF